MSCSTADLTEERETHAHRNTMYYWKRSNCVLGISKHRFTSICLLNFSTDNNASLYVERVLYHSVIFECYYSLRYSLQEANVLDNALNRLKKI